MEYLFLWLCEYVRCIFICRARLFPEAFWELEVQLWTHLYRGNWNWEFPTSSDTYSTNKINTKCKDGGSVSVSVNIGIFWSTYRYRYWLDWKIQYRYRLIAVFFSSIGIGIGKYRSFWSIGISIGRIEKYSISIGENNTDPPSLIQWLSKVSCQQ